MKKKIKISFFYLCLLLLFNTANGNECFPKKINKISDLDEVMKVCNHNDKILIKFNSQVEVEYLIVKLCNLNFSLYYNFEKNIIISRDPYSKLVCVYDEKLN